MQENITTRERNAPNERFKSILGTLLVSSVFFAGAASAGLDDFSLPTGYSVPPLVNGRDGAQFKYRALLMVTADQKRETLNYGPLLVARFSDDDLTGFASSLIDKLMANGAVSTVFWDIRGSSHGVRYANAVFFLVSIHPNILVSIPATSADIVKDTLLGSTDTEKTLFDFVRETNAVQVANVLFDQKCARTASGIAGECAMEKRAEVANRVVVSQVFLKREGALVVDEDQALPVALGTTITTGGKTFKIINVKDHDQYLAIVPVR